MIVDERDVEKYLKQQVEKRGGLCWKFVSPGNAGVPDRLVILPKKIIFVELKAPKKEARKLQEARAKQLKSLGFEFYVLDTKEKVKEVISNAI